MPSVFISYSHDSPAHRDSVLVLSDRLRGDGVDCRIDQYEESPQEGWRDAATSKWRNPPLCWSYARKAICSDSKGRKCRRLAWRDVGRAHHYPGALVMHKVAIRSSFLSRSLNTMPYSRRPRWKGLQGTGSPKTMIGCTDVSLAIRAGAGTGPRRGGHQPQ